MTKGYDDIDPKDMEELMKKTSSAFSDTTITVCQLVIALQNHLSMSQVVLSGFRKMATILMGIMVSWQ